MIDNNHALYIAHLSISLHAPRMSGPHAPPTCLTHMAENKMAEPCATRLITVLFKAGLTIMKGGGPMSNVAILKTSAGFVTLSEEQSSLKGASHV